MVKSNGCWDTMTFSNLKYKIGWRVRFPTIRYRSSAHLMLTFFFCILIMESYSKKLLDKAFTEKASYYHINMAFKVAIWCWEKYFNDGVPI